MLVTNAKGELYTAFQSLQISESDSLLGLAGSFTQSHLSEYESSGTEQWCKKSEKAYLLLIDR